jgi:hypothetical protein
MRPTEASKWTRNTRVLAPAAALQEIRQNLAPSATNTRSPLTGRPLSPCRTSTSSLTIPGLWAELTTQTLSCYHGAEGCNSTGIENDTHRWSVA